MRIVTMTLPPLLRDIFIALAVERDHVDIVAEFNRRADAAEIGHLAPDCVILGLRRGEADQIARRLAAGLPAAKIIAISHDGRDAYVHEMPDRRLALPDAAPAALAAAMSGPNRV
jgi:DNA-binding NarL/FixJ family response regulator